MALWKKIIIVISVVSSLFVSMLISISAVSVGTPTGIANPLFAPSSIIVDHYSEGNMLVDLPLTLTFDPGNLSFGEFSNSSYPISGDIDSVYDIYGSISAKDSSFLSGYGLSYFRSDFDISMTGLYPGYFSGDFLTYYDPIYIPSSLLTNSSSKLNWLSNWNLYFVDNDSGDYLLPSKMRVSFHCYYIDKTNYQLRSVLAQLETSNTSSHSQRITDIIYDYITSNISSTNRLGGVVVSELLVQYIDFDNSYFVEFEGESKYCLNSSLGFYKAEDAWKGYRNVTVQNIVSDKTVLGSIVGGIGEIWGLELFGEFTIGNLFMSVVGLSCFIWLLKIFAGG